MKRNQVVLAVVAAVVLAALVFVSLRQRRTTPDSSAVHVAALLNLTGPAARFDAVKKQALELAVERLKSQRPDLALDLRIADAGGAPDTALAAGRRALREGAQYVLTGTSPTALAVAGLARGRTPPVVQIANAANPEFGPPRPGEYRFWPDWKQEARVVNALLRSEGIRSVVVIHSADPYSEALRAAFESLAAAAPPVEVRSQQYDPAGTPDFRPLLLRAKNDGVGALVVFGLPPGIKALMGQLLDVKWEVPVIGGVNTNLAVDEYDKAGLTCGLWAVETEAMIETLRPGSEADAFRAAFRQKYDTVPPFHALYMADALYFIAAAHRSPGSPTLSELDRVRAVRDFEGPSGAIRVGEDGVLEFELTARKVR